MIKKFLIASILFCLILCSCSTDITQLLNSNKTNDLIEGAIAAGKTGDKKYVPLLLKNCGEPSVSTNYKFNGVSVYQAKMRALRDIYKISPPAPINMVPDSAVIKFYISLYEKERK